MHSDQHPFHHAFCQHRSWIAAMLNKDAKAIAHFSASEAAFQALLYAHHWDQTDYLALAGLARNEVLKQCYRVEYHVLLHHPEWALAIIENPLYARRLRPEIGELLALLELHYDALPAAIHQRLHRFALDVLQGNRPALPSIRESCFDIVVQFTPPGWEEAANAFLLSSLSTNLLENAILSLYHRVDWQPPPHLAPRLQAYSEDSYHQEQSPQIVRCAKLLLQRLALASPSSNPAPDVASESLDCLGIDGLRRLGSLFQETVLGRKYTV